MSNVNRDNKNIKALQEMGFRVLTIWECELKQKSQEKLEEIVKLLKNQINRILLKPTYLVGFFN